MPSAGPRPLRLFLVLVLAAILAATATAQKRGDGTVVVGDLGRDLDATVLATMPDFWGCVVVARGGELCLAKGYGSADGAQLANGPRILYDTGSFAGHFTQALALRLQKEKKLRLDEPVGRYLRGVPADKAKLTVRHLLEHRSGLPVEVELDDGAARVLRTAVERLLAAKLDDEPGATVRYSAANMILLAAVLETVGGGRFEELLHKRVFQPARMDDTGCLGDRRLDKNRQSLRRSPRDPDGEGVLAADLTWAARGARGVISTGLDLHAWFDALLGGRVLDDDDRAVLLRPLDGRDAWSVTRRSFGGIELVELAGVTQGYRSRVLLVPGTRTWIVLLSDQVTELQRLQGALARVLAGQAPPPPGEGRPEPKPEPKPAERPEPEPAAPPLTGPPSAMAVRFVGTFAAPGGGRFVVTAHGDRLTVLGLGLQPSARTTLGRWPDGAEAAELRRCEDAGLAAIARLQQGDHAGAAAAFAGDDALVRARAALRAATGGATAPRIEFAGTDPGARESWFWVDVADGRWLKGAWAKDGRLQGLERSPTAPPFVAACELQRPDWAVGRSADGTVVSVSVEGEGQDRRLVWEDATAGADGILECGLLR